MADIDISDEIFPRQSIPCEREKAQPLPRPGPANGRDSPQAVHWQQTQQFKSDSDKTTCYVEKSSLPWIDFTWIWFKIFELSRACHSILTVPLARTVQTLYSHCHGDSILTVPRLSTQCPVAPALSPGPVAPGPRPGPCGRHGDSVTVARPPPAPAAALETGAASWLPLTEAAAAAATVALAPGLVGPDPA